MFSNSRPSGNPPHFSLQFSPLSERFTATLVA
jgi:hypothetical protein